MLARIPNLLTASQVGHCVERLGEADWRDGRITAGPQSALVKSNDQVLEGSTVAVQLGDLIVTELERNPRFLSAALPRLVFPPLFNRYGPGQGFGTHIDNALRPLPNTGQRIRTDLSATLFLSDPASYDGGELVIEHDLGSERIKLPAGHMILYPASSLHRVEPVTRGTRLAAFFWIQSIIRDDGARGILHQMDIGIQEMTAAAPGAPGLVRLTGAYHNLVRRWGEL
jgi:PKHD-type hydroxylase